MSQQDGEYEYLTGRMLELLAGEYGFREHWRVDMSSNLARGSVATIVTLRQRPNENSRGDVTFGFDTPNFIFSEFRVVRGNVLDCAQQIINSLRYRNRADNHPPQVKIYCWLEEHRQEVRDQYMVPEYRPVAVDSPFSNSIHLQILLQDLLRDVVGGPVVVNSHEVRLGESGSIGEMNFHSARSLSLYVNQLQMNRSSAPAVTNQPRSHIRKVVL